MPEWRRIPEELLAAVRGRIDAAQLLLDSAAQHTAQLARVVLVHTPLAALLGERPAELQQVEDLLCTAWQILHLTTLEQQAQSPSRHRRRGLRIGAALLRRNIRRGPLRYRQSWAWGFIRRQIHAGDVSAWYPHLAAHRVQRWWPGRCRNRLSAAFSRGPL